MGLPYCEVWLGEHLLGTELDNIQSVNFSQGRNKITDNYRSGNGTITGKFPNLLPTIAIGDTITVLAFYDGSIATEYVFTVADFRINYGIVPNEDIWSIDVEDCIALFGRQNIDVSWVANDDVAFVMNDVGIAAGSVVSAITTGKFVSAQTLTNVNALDVLQSLANTAQGLFQVLKNRLIYYPQGRFEVVTRLNCSDTPTGSDISFDRLIFAGLADNYVQQVIATAPGLSDAVVGSGVSNYQYATFQNSQSELTNNATYVLSALSDQIAKPTQISINVNSLSTNAIIILNTVFSQDAIRRADIEFRGSTYKTLVLGFQFSSVPGQMRYTLNLASLDFFPTFILDSATFGVLDQNKLGF